MGSDPIDFCWEALSPGFIVTKLIPRPIVNRADVCEAKLTIGAVFLLSCHGILIGIQSLCSQHHFRLEAKN